MRAARLAVLCCAVCPALVAAGQRGVPLSKAVAETIAAGLSELGTDADRNAADAQRFADATALAANERDVELLVAAEAFARLTAICARLPAADAQRLAVLARERPMLVRRFVFQLDFEHDDPAAAVSILLDQVGSFGLPTVTEFGRLAVALALVHDQPTERNVNENTVRADDANAVFGYFTSNADQLQIDPRHLPADILVFLVSATEGVSELEWARRTYSRDRNHGSRFFEIEYDIEHFRTGRPKAVTLAPRYSIRAIKEFGGVCADQAYFAEHVAKANGVPAAYMVGRSGEVAHAWLGYLRASRSGLRWDFDAGRYDAYQGVRGATFDPQTRQVITDGVMAMRASDAGISDDLRWQAAALARAADRVSAYDKASGEALVAEIFPGRKAARHGEPSHRVELLKMSVERRPGDIDAWRVFASLAAEGGVKNRTIDTWLTAFARSAGRTSPDTLTDIVELLLGAVSESATQVEVLERAMPRLRGRSDLQAWVRLKQGEVFESMGDLDMAWRAYDDVTRRFLNKGPFAIEAIDRMLAMLARSGKQGPDLDLLKRTFSEAERPFALGGFRSQSNWYRIGTRYADRLHAAGAAAAADEVLRQIDGS